MLYEYFIEYSAQAIYSNYFVLNRANMHVYMNINDVV